MDLAAFVRDMRVLPALRSLLHGSRCLQCD